MSLATILSRVKTINAAIAGVTTACDHTDVPDSLNTGNLPGAIVLAGEGDLTYGGGGDALATHRLRLLLYVVPASRGNLAQNVAACIPFVERFRNAYAQAMQLDSLSGVNWAYLRDYRVGLLPAYGGTEYVGVEFTLEVEEQESVTVGL